MLVHRNLMLVLKFIFVLVMIVPVVSSCQQAAPGYKFFTGRTEGLRISFEYPDTWRRKVFEKHDAFENSRLQSDNSAYVDISSNVNAANGGNFENAHARLEDWLDSFSSQQEFKILSRGKMLLGNIEGEEAVYSYFDRSGSIPFLDYHQGMTYSPLPDRYVIKRFLAVDYKGRIYSFLFGVDADEYESVKESFEHLLATFKFLD